MKQPKKSETLEVRLSHPDKLALQKQAAREGRTVSDVVRGLISSYLSQGENRSQPSHLTELFMTLKSKPKSVFATFACAPLLLIPFLMPGTASAENVAMRVKGEYSQAVEENGVPGKRVRRFEYDIHMNANGQRNLDIQTKEGTLTIAITSQEVEEGLALKFAILNENNVWNMTPRIGTYKSPELRAKYDSDVRVEIGYEDGEAFTFTVTPSTLTP